jgi:hypothetical protein
MDVDGPTRAVPDKHAKAPVVFAHSEDLSAYLYAALPVEVKHNFQNAGTRHILLLLTTQQLALRFLSSPVSWESRCGDWFRRRCLCQDLLRMAICSGISASDICIDTI